ncbi:MAG: DUF4139 domain-containing protein, partial [Sphingorhabdus sp.]
LQLQCWPVQRTHQVPYNPGYLPSPPPPPPPSPEMMYDMANAESIVVTAQRRTAKMAMAAPVAVVVAEQEDLGDLKLYRIPEPVTVNAKGQKQVAMIVRPGAAFDRIYITTVANDYDGESESMPMTILFRGENAKEKGLGLPMPSGQVMVFENSSYGPLLAGQSTLKDRAIGDEIEMTIGQAFDVRYRVTKLSETRRTQRFKVEITNARGEAVNAEIGIPFELRGKVKGVSKVDGVPTWKGAVPANGETAFEYEVKLGR